MSLLYDGIRGRKCLNVVLETRKKRGKEVEALPHDVSLRERWGKNDPSCSSSLHMLTFFEYQNITICIYR